MFVDIYPFQFYGLPVDIEQAQPFALAFLFALSDFYPAESDTKGNVFRPAVGRFDLHREFIEIRRFGRPFQHAVDPAVESRGPYASRWYQILCIAGENGFPRRIGQFEGDSGVRVATAAVAQFHFEPEDAVRVTVVECRPHPEVGQRDRSLRP